jgi:membrane-bound metal-dependent hydrolase YbcI (DUF457 family)
MDNLTHSLVGAVIAKAGLEKKCGKGTTLTLVLASNVTDIDGILMFTAEHSHLCRRMWTHSVFAWPVLAIGLAYLLHHLRLREIPVRTLFGLSMLGIGLHVFFDLLNSYGVVLLWPMSVTRFELSWIFVIDLAVWGILLFPFLFYRIPRLELTTLARGSVLILALYIGFAAVSRWKATRQLDELLADEPEPEFRYVFHELLGPHRWRGVVRVGNTYRQYLLHPWTGSIEPGPEVYSALDNPLVQRARFTPPGKNLEWFTKAPVWTLENGEVILWDLRFTSLVMTRDRIPFRFVVDPDSE